MRSFGVYKGGNSENAPFVVFASFCAQKEEYLTFPLESETPAFACFAGRKNARLRICGGAGERDTKVVPPQIYPLYNIIDMC